MDNFISIRLNEEVSRKNNDITSLEKYLIENNIYGVIYMVTNIITNKSYIGRKRLKEKGYYDLHNYYGSGIHIRNSINKYGIDNFKKVYLDIASNDEELDKKEIYYIEKYDTYHNGYNATIGGEHFRGVFSNNETRKKKISEWSKNYWKDETKRAELLKARSGRKNSELTKKIMSESAKKSWTEERKQQARNSGNYSRVISAEQKEFLSKTNKGRVKINNGTNETQVLKEELENYLNNGWILGAIPFSRKHLDNIKRAAKNRGLGSKWLIKDGIKKKFKKEEVEVALKEGWQFPTEYSRKRYESNLHKQS